MDSSQRSRLAPLYNPAYEHDACGVGLVVDIAGRPSREIVERGLAGLVNLAHRGGIGADERTGDGAGILTQVPFRLFAPELAKLGYPRLGAGEFGVAMTFLPQDPASATRAELEFEAAAHHGGLKCLGWRDVPVEPAALGTQAAATQPRIRQLLLGQPGGGTADEFERQLMLVRRAAERRMAAAGIEDFFVVSCSARTLIYKGFVLPQDLIAFYTDLRDPAYTSAIALFHQRFSTNTLPSWALAQPFRFLAHNGEINTIQGNRGWMTARASSLQFPDGTSGETLQPVVSLGGSDSLSLDNTLELLYHGGRSLPHALMMLVPEPWEQLPEMPPKLRAFYDFHAGLTEPWDGPAALGFSDGVLAGATLDRNGLRPLRYAITADGRLVAGSEAGTVEIDPAQIIEKGKLGPGQMIVVDTARGIVLRNDDIKAEVAGQAPYALWLKEGRVKLNVPELPGAENAIPEGPERVAIQRAFGYTAEDIRLIVQPMAGDGKEPTWSMGDDAPLAVLSTRARPLTSYFRQRFAQVTNPAIDSLRERKVMALDSFLGPHENFLIEDPAQARLVHLPSAVISAGELAALTALDTGPLRAAHFSTLIEAPAIDEDGTPSVPMPLEAGLNTLVNSVVHAVREQGVSLLILSDRGVDAARAPMPMLLAVAAIHRELIRQGLRPRADLVVETGEVWDVHHLACLVGYGASAVHPYMGLDAAAALAGTRGFQEQSAEELQANYVKALENGLLKIASKMGISTVMGYRGAQIFEAIGLNQNLIDRYFTGTPSRLDGVGLAELADDLQKRHHEAFAAPAAKLPDAGLIRFRKEGETHAFSPTIVKQLQKTVKTNDPADYAVYREMVQAQPPTALRDLLTRKPIGPALPLSEVEPIEAITKRFYVTAMSLGALSPEASRTLSIAMNRMGARSNSGEGGEDPAWYDEPGPDIPHNKIKQVASARFGVTARYLTHAQELEIKISQGSKPGEGGQLPGHKVTEFIAHLRHAVPGLPLISPPPHHDIYSIEDLAQLIYDLRQINPKAVIGVKLVAESGVGTIAAGVAKARADYILISGHVGGTGASPLASIKHAGCPWELGLAETQQTLVLNGLRSRVKLRTDGGLKLAEDIVTAAMLGAEEYGFGTSAMVAIGCDMARQCHLNTCPTGIATQNPVLRKKFAGEPEHVISYFTHLAEDVRQLMAKLGARTLDELVGRSDLLEVKPVEGRGELLDLSAVLAEPAPPEMRRKTTSIDLSERTLDDKILEVAGPALADGKSVGVTERIVTHDRTVGARIAGVLANRPDAATLRPGRVTCRFTGSAGQSFGAFAVNGMRLLLEGEANDYVAKGISGGEIAITPPRHAAFTTPQAIAGNTILYGATGGALFLAGRAGERFAVRNSGAVAVVEGVGDHGCEYMTGGTVVVLGPTGRNFGAGMTNGLAYVLDADGTFAGKINDESVLLGDVDDDDAIQVRALIERHVELTHSRYAQSLLADWPATLDQFWKVIPRAALTLVPTTEEVTEGVAD